FLNHEPIRARRTGPLGRAWRWCRRKPAVAVLLGCVAALAVVTGIVSAVSNWRLGVEAERARQAGGGGREEGFKGTFAQAQALRKSGEMGQRFQALDTIAEAVGIARSLGVLDEHVVALRSEAAACLALADLRVAEEWEVPVHWDADWAPSVAFDGKLQRY